MALEKRGRSVYYYRSYRQGKKVKRKYIAAGEDAELAAAIQDHRRLIQQIERERIKAFDAACANAFRMLALLGTVTGLLIKAVLLSKTSPRRIEAAVRNEKAFPTYTILELQEIVRRAERGDESALPELRSILDDCPQIWREASSLEIQTREMWIG